MHGTSNLIVARAHQRADEQTDVLNLIRCLAEVYGNADTVREELALEAVSEGRSAWWVSTDHGNQTLLNVALHANRRSLEAALKVFADPAYPAGTRHPLSILANLIPLNKQADAEKEEAVANAVKGNV